MGQIISDFATWIIDLLLWFPRKAFELLTDGLAAVIGAIPVDWIANASSAAASVPSGALWAMDLMAFGYGLSVMVTAVTARFLLRRIPFIG